MSDIPDDEDKDISPSDIPADEKLPEDIEAEIAQEDRFISGTNDSISDQRISASGLTRAEFISIFNEGTKIVSQMTDEQIIDRIAELDRAIAKLKIHSHSSRSVLTDRETKLSREEKQKLRDYSKKYVVKEPISESKPRKAAKSQKEKAYDKMIALGMNHEQATKMCAMLPED